MRRVPGGSTLRMWSSCGLKNTISIAAVSSVVSSRRLPSTCSATRRGLVVEHVDGNRRDAPGLGFDQRRFVTSVDQTERQMEQEIENARGVHICPERLC